MSEPAAGKKKRGGLLFGVVVVVLVAALGTEAYLLFNPRLVALRAGAQQTVEEFGSASAPVKIEFYAPLTLPWHVQTIGLLRKYDATHPGRIHVKLMPMGNDKCEKEMTKRGFACAVIFINGKHEFTLPNGRKVDLQKKPNYGDESFYNSEDVITIIDGMKT